MDNVRVIRIDGENFEEKWFDGSEVEPWSGRCRYYDTATGTWTDDLDRADSNMKVWYEPTPSIVMMQLGNAKPIRLRTIDLHEDGRWPERNDNQVLIHADVESPYYQDEVTDIAFTLRMDNDTAMTLSIWMNTVRAIVTRRRISAIFTQPPLES